MLTWPRIGAFWTPGPRGKRLKQARTRSRFQIVSRTAQTAHGDELPTGRKPRPEQGPGQWAVQGSNLRPPACKAGSAFATGCCWLPIPGKSRRSVAVERRFVCRRLPPPVSRSFPERGSRLPLLKIRANLWRTTPIGVRVAHRRSLTQPTSRVVRLADRLGLRRKRWTRRPATGEGVSGTAQEVV